MLDFKDEVVEFSYKGEKYQVEKTTVGQSRAYARELKEANTDELQEMALFNFLEKLGLKKEVSESLKQNHIMALIQALGEVEKN